MTPSQPQADAVRVDASDAETAAGQDLRLRHWRAYGDVVEITHTRELSADGAERVRVGNAVHAYVDALAGYTPIETAGARLLVALRLYGFPVSEAAANANMSIEARNLHNAARRFQIAINSTGSVADEPAMTNGQ